MKRFLHYTKNIILPCFVFSAATGFLTAWAVMGFKWCAARVIGYSQQAYALLRARPVFLAVAVPILAAVAAASHWFYRFFPDAKGGGIPTSIAILRGVLQFRWLRNIFGVFIASLTTFFLGVPLGNEGPSVQMGTDIGRGLVRLFGRKNEAWDRYVMTGGACAGFSVATGAPLSGILFAVEEAHHRISPMILMVSATTVVFATGFSRAFSDLLHVPVSLFGTYTVPKFAVRDLWIPLAMGLFIGLGSVLFIYGSRLLERLGETVLKKADISIKVFLSLLLTLGCGFLSAATVGTGHIQIENALLMKYGIGAAIAVLLVRAVLMLFSNHSGMTGGMFLPILALGALAASAFAQVLRAWGMSDSFYTAAVLLGIVACLAGTIKSPLTAIVFGLEALSLSENIPALLIAALSAFTVTEIFGAHSLNESTIKLRVKQLTADRPIATYEASVTVSEDAFAVGKSIRDIFWPNNLFVLSLRPKADAAVVDEHGEKTVRAGDTLHVRFSTGDYDTTVRELAAIVGNRDFVPSLKKTF